MDDSVKIIAEILEDHLDLVVEFNKFIVKSKTNNEVFVFF